MHDTFVLQLSCPRLDGESGEALFSLVEKSVKEGAKTIVLDLGPRTVVDFAGARALERASALVTSVTKGGTLHVAGLNARARTLLRSLRVIDSVSLVEWWADAVSPRQHAA